MCIQRYQNHNWSCLQIPSSEFSIRPIQTQKAVYLGSAGIEQSYVNLFSAVLNQIDMKS